MPRFPSELQNPLFVNEAQASQMFGRSRAWFQRKRWDGSGPPFYKNPGKAGAITYNLAEIKEWFANNRRTSTSQQ